MYIPPCSRHTRTLLNHNMSSRTYFHASSGVAQIKKVRVYVLGLILNHYKLAHFCFLSDLYRMELLLFLVKKDSSLASQDSQFFSLHTNWIIRLLLFEGDRHPNPRLSTIQVYLDSYGHSNFIFTID